MNKHKKNLEALRRYLGRDTAGLVLLDDVARDISEQRKRIAELEASESRARTLADSHRRELDHAQTQVAQLKAEVSREQAKRIAADNREKRTADRIAAMESDDEAADENANFSMDDVMARRVRKLSRDVMRRYKRPPKPDGGTIDLDEVVVNYTVDEFTGLGMLVAFFATFLEHSPRVRCVREVKDANLPISHRAKVFHWLGPWLKSSNLYNKIKEACGVELL